MTMQVAMVGTDGILLASDTRWADMRGVRNTYSASKIRINDDLGIAVSYARNMEAGRMAADAVLAMSDEDWQWPIISIEKAAQVVIDGAGERNDVQCLIVSTRPTLRLFFLRAAFVDGEPKRAMCDEIMDKAIAGDNTNPALFWIERYYETMPVEQLSLLAAHLIVSAGNLNNGAIGGLEIVICSTSGCVRLPEARIRELKLKAQQWDRVTRESLATPGVTVDKDKFDALLGKMIATPPTPHAEVRAPRARKRKPRKPSV